MSYLNKFLLTTGILLAPILAFGAGGNFDYNASSRTYGSLVVTSSLTATTLGISVVPPDSGHRVINLYAVNLTTNPIFMSDVSITSSNNGIPFLTNANGSIPLNINQNPLRNFNTRYFLLEPSDGPKSVRFYYILTYGE